MALLAQTLGRWKSLRSAGAPGKENPPPKQEKLGWGTRRIFGAGHSILCLEDRQWTIPML
jgi:hypothetical protein